MTGEVPMPEDDVTHKELKNLNAVCVEVPVTSFENVVLGRGGDSVYQFSQTIKNLIETKEIF